MKEKREKGGVLCGVLTKLFLMENIHRQIQNSLLRQK